MPTPRRQMPRRIYPLRILGMGLGGMVVATVLWERQASPLAWTALLLATLVWPHVAYLLTRRAADPYAADTPEAMRAMPQHVVMTLLCGERTY